MRAGETDIAETIDAEPFMMIAKQISKELRHIANLDVDCFVEEDGNICVLEMNCRFGGQYPFTHNAGVDEPKQIIKWLEGNPTDFSLLQQINGVRSCKELNPVIKSITGKNYRKHKFHQRLTREDGYIKLKELIAADMALMRVYDDWNSFEVAYRKSYNIPDDETI